MPHAKYFHIFIKSCMHGWLHLKYILLVNSLFIHLDCIGVHNEQEVLQHLFNPPPLFLPPYCILYVEIIVLSYYLTIKKLFDNNLKVGMNKMFY